jgi:putative transposase
LLIAVVVHPGDIQDRDGAKLVLGVLANTFLRLRLIWADSAYAGQLIEWVAQLRGAFRPIALEIVKRSDDLRGFYVLPRRWVVERTFGWFGRWRRLSKDYEFRTDTSEAIIRIVMMRLMLRRVAGHRAWRRRQRQLTRRN